MKQLLEYIIPNIVNHPEDVVINESTDSNGDINLTIKVHDEDTGRVIGKAGKVIKAIRQIARVIAIKQGVRVNIDVLDGQDRAPRSTEQTVYENPEETQEETVVEETGEDVSEPLLNEVEETAQEVVEE